MEKHSNVGRIFSDVAAVDRGPVQQLFSILNRKVIRVMFLNHETLWHLIILWVERWQEWQPGDW